ncbi:MAG: homoserine kinase [Armatimonadetes bacterium]|nr:homoserine kinase [Armatimonadota bacterium]
MSALRRVTVKVPATIANLGPGFDALGLAVRFYNVLTVERAERTEVTVTGAGADRLPRDGRNLVLRTAEEVAQKAGRALGPLRVTQRNAIPLRRGLGSSAAAIAGGTVAANALLGDPLPLGALLDLACGLEGHPDNVTPALVGGLVACTLDGGRVRWAKVDVRGTWRLVLAIPEVEVSTAEARRLLPQTVPFPDAVFNVGRAALLVAALTGDRPDLLGAATQDRLHQPYRRPLVPWLEAVMDAARGAGAYGVMLSGSGPTVAAFAPDGACGEAMQRALAGAGVACQIVVTEIDPEGARVVKEDNPVRV